MIHDSQCFFLEKNFGGGANQNREGHRLELKYIKFKLAKAQGEQDHFQGGGGGIPPSSNPPKNRMYIYTCISHTLLYYHVKRELPFSVHLMKNSRSIFHL